MQFEIIEIPILPETEHVPDIDWLPDWFYEQEVQIAMPRARAIIGIGQNLYP